MALSKQTLILTKWLYWIGLSLVQLYVVYMLFKTGRSLAAIIWLIFGFILIYLFYPVYFPRGDPGSHWPPYISACPDYLTRLAPDACVDYVGLNSPLLRRADPANPPAITDSQYVFNSAGTVSQKAARAQQYGLSWEGIA